MPKSRSNKWVQVGHSPQFLDMWAQQFGDIPAPRAYVFGELRAMVGREPVVKGDPRWHVSVSTETRIPTWDEMVNAAHTLRPGVVFVIGVPPESWWMSVHPFTLHLWETTDAHMVAEWQRNAGTHRSTIVTRR